MNYYLYVLINFVVIVVILIVVSLLLSFPMKLIANSINRIFGMKSESLTVTLQTVLEYVPKLIGVIAAGCVSIFLQSFATTVYEVEDNSNWSEVVYWSGTKNLSDDASRPCVVELQRGYIYVYNKGEKTYKISYPKPAEVLSHDVYVQEIEDDYDRELFEKKQLDKKFKQSLFGL